MGRKRKRLELSEAQTAEMHHLLHITKDAREMERLRAALWAGSGRYTLEELARKAGRSRATIQNWFAKFNRGGVSGLLERDTPPGRVSPVAGSRIQAEMIAGLRVLRWRSAAEVADWLRREHGVKRSRKSMYYWLEKSGLGAPKRKKARLQRKKAVRRPTLA